MASNTALMLGLIADDDILWFNPRITSTIITKGDYIVASGSAIIAGESSLNGQYLRASGIGIALANNPTYDELGVARVHTGLPVVRRGIVRVSAASASALGNWPVAQPVYPATTSSGIVGLLRRLWEQISRCLFGPSAQKWAVQTL